MKTNQIPEWILRFTNALSKKKPDVNMKKKGMSLCEAEELLKDPGVRIARWRPERERRVDPRESGECGD